MKTPISILAIIISSVYFSFAHSAVSIKETLLSSGDPIFCGNFKINVTDQILSEDIKNYKTLLIELTKNHKMRHV